MIRTAVDSAAEGAGAMLPEGQEVVMARGAGPPLNLSNETQGTLMAIIAVALVIFVWWTWR